MTHTELLRSRDLGNTSTRMVIDFIDWEDVSDE